MQNIDSFFEYQTNYLFINFCIVPDILKKIGYKNLKICFYKYVNKQI